MHIYIFIYSIDTHALSDTNPYTHLQIHDLFVRTLRDLHGRENCSCNKICKKAKRRSQEKFFLSPKKRFRAVKISGYSYRSKVCEMGMSVQNWNSQFEKLLFGSLNF